jgi:hypothetical protein
VPATARQAYSGREAVGSQIGAVQAGATSGRSDALGQAALHGPLLGIHKQGGHPGVATARGVLEGFSQWIICAETTVGAAVRQVQGRLTTMTDTQAAPSDTRKFGKTAGVQAKEDADRICKEVLDRFIAERQTATSQFESAILFIGETAGC